MEHQTSTRTEDKEHKQVEYSNVVNALKKMQREDEEERTGLYNDDEENDQENGTDNNQNGTQKNMEEEDKDELEIVRGASKDSMSSNESHGIYLAVVDKSIDLMMLQTAKTRSRENGAHNLAVSSQELRKVNTVLTKVIEEKDALIRDKEKKIKILAREKADMKRRLDRLVEFYISPDMIEKLKEENRYKRRLGIESDEESFDPSGERDGTTSDEGNESVTEKLHKPCVRPKKRRVDGDESLSVAERLSREWFQCPDPILRGTTAKSSYYRKNVEHVLNEFDCKSRSDVLMITSEEVRKMFPASRYHVFSTPFKYFQMWCKSTLNEDE